MTPISHGKSESERLVSDEVIEVLMNEYGIDVSVIVYDARQDDYLRFMKSLGRFPES